MKEKLDTTSGSPEQGLKKVIGTHDEEILLIPDQEFDGFTVGERFSIRRAEEGERLTGTLPSRASSSSDIYVAGFTDGPNGERLVVLNIDSSATPPNGHFICSVDFVRNRFEKTDKTKPYLGGAEYA
ncbi:MAG: hypothetical protein Q7R62_00245 [bacterium]|nr:hypothetical protein [bacterium]